LGLASEERERGVTLLDLLTMGLPLGAAASVELTPAAVGTANVLLFDSGGLFLGVPNFQGQFVQVMNPTPGSAWTRVGLTPLGFAGRVASVVLAHTQPSVETRLSLGLLRFQWNDMIDGLFGTSATRDGQDPIISWDAFPTGVASLDASKVYARIVQPMIVRVSGWYDYRASFGYHVEFRMLSTGGVEARVTCPPTIWVDDGVAHDEIMIPLTDKVASASGRLESALNDVLKGFGTGFKEVYLLPGVQSVAPTGTVFQDSTESDVTVVLVRAQ
jgi:hypothetical protein